jgi:hypothetical protein
MDREPERALDPVREVLMQPARDPGWQRREDDFVEVARPQCVANCEEWTLVTDRAVDIDPERAQRNEGLGKPPSGHRSRFTLGPEQAATRSVRRDQHMESAPPCLRALAYPCNELVTSKGLVRHDEIPDHDSPDAPSSTFTG